MAAVTIGLTDELIKARKRQAEQPAPVAKAEEPEKAPKKKPVAKK